MNLLLNIKHSYPAWTSLKYIDRCFLKKHLLPGTVRCIHSTENCGQNVKSKTNVARTKTAVASEHDSKMVRNIGIIAHIDAGKTTTTERMLFYSGYTRHMGDVDDGDTVTDYMEQERNRGITITSAAVTFLWKKHKINLIDTPGHVDFTLEVERALRVLDGAVTILDASAGVEAQTVTVWRQANSYSIPRIIYMNKMDKRGANFEMSVESLQTKLNAKPLVLQIPLGREKDFIGVADIVKMQKYEWKDEDTQGMTFEGSPISPEDGELWTRSVKLREQLLGQLCDVDDSIAECVLSDTNIHDIPSELIYRAVRKATIKHSYCPILCGSSFKKKGVQLLLDAIALYLPSPIEIHHGFIEFYKDELCALAFKTIHEKQRGALTFLRLYTGTITSASSIYNVNRGCSEKITRLLQVHADDLKELQSASAGNIVAVSGLKETITGDTITSSQTAAKEAEKQYRKKLRRQDDAAEDEDERPVLAGMVIPEPVFFCSVEPPSLTYQKQLDHALTCLTREDPSLTVRVDEETGQTILGGMGELHLEVVKDRILKEYSVDVYTGPLMIAYKETINKPASHTELLDISMGDNRHRVEVTLTVKPSATITPPSNVSLAHDRHSDLAAKLRKFHYKALKAGLQASLSRGPLLGYGVVGFEVELEQFSVGYGTSLPNMIACVSQAIYNALKKGEPALLEPMMSLEIQTDENYVGRVMSDLSQRRAILHEVAPGDSSRTVVASAPLSQLLGYSTALRTMTSGTASLSMHLDTYHQMSPDEQYRTIQTITGFAR